MLAGKKMHTFIVHSGTQKQFRLKKPQDMNSVLDKIFTVTSVLLRTVGGCLLILDKISCYDHQHFYINLLHNNNKKYTIKTNQESRIDLSNFFGL